MDIAAILNTGNQSIQKTEEKSDDLGRDDFLTMFIAQMEHQDPLNPMDGTEFSAQLAQFSSLEQLFNISSTLETMKSGQDIGTSYNALGFIGKDVVAEGNLISFELGKVATGGFTLAQAADCAVAITDSDGNLVRQLALGPIAAGEQTFEWDGKNDAGIMMSPGTYNFQVAALDSYNQPVQVDTQITGQVTGVNLDGSAPTLYVGDIALSISQISEIKIHEDTTQQGGDGSSSGSGGTDGPV